MFLRFFDREPAADNVIANSFELGRLTFDKFFNGGVFADVTESHVQWNLHASPQFQISAKLPGSIILRVSAAAIEINTGRAHGLFHGAIGDISPLRLRRGWAH